MVRNMAGNPRSRTVAALLALALALSGCAYLRGTTAEPSAPSAAPVSRATTRARTADKPTVATAATTQAPLPFDPPEVEPDPAPSDSAGVARLLHLAQLWHTVSLHHPWVATRGVPWDSALIVAVTRVRAANTNDALETAYRKLLLVLRDPITRIERAGTPEPAPVAVAADRTTDSVLVIRIAPTAPLNANDSAIVSQALVGVSPRVLIDVRGAPSSDPADFAERLDAFLVRTGVVDKLAAGDMTAPIARTRRVGTISTLADLQDVSRFRDGWQTPADRIYRGHGQPSTRIVLLADSGSTLPPVLLALHDVARAALVADGGLRDAPPVSRVRVALGNGLEAVVRTGDLVHLDGTLDVVPDTTIARAGSGDAAQQYALDRLRSTARLPLAERPLPRYVVPATTPVFYDTTSYPFMGARVLAGFRAWSAMRARHAYRDLYDDDIDAVLERVVPRLESANSASTYALAVAELAASTNDPSGTVRGRTMDGVQGDASLPFRVRGADGRVFLTDVIRDSTTTRLALTNGTELVAVDGFPVNAWFSDHARTQPSTNEWSRNATLLAQLPRGRSGDALVRVRDANNRERALSVPRRTSYRDALPTMQRPDGAASRLLADGMAYIDVERLTDGTVDAAFSSVTTARGLVLDLRGALAVDDARLLRRLATRPRAAVARVVQRALTTPCLVTLREASTECPDVRETSQWIRTIDTAAVLSARIVALVDERTQGAMERFALALEQMSGVMFVGSPTAGALSPATTMSLPGGLSMGIPSYELRRADGSQVQRVGITPTIEARPTVRGVRAGDDEVLTRAQQWLQQQLEPARRRR